MNIEIMTNSLILIERIHFVKIQYLSSKSASFVNLKDTQKWLFFGFYVLKVVIHGISGSENDHFLEFAVPKNDHFRGFLEEILLK